MGFFKEDNGEWKIHKLGSCALIVFMLVVVAFVVFNPPKSDVLVINTTSTVINNYNITNYNTDNNVYNAVLGDKTTAWDSTGCKMLEMGSGGYALVCKK